MINSPASNYREPKISSILCIKNNQKISRLWLFFLLFLSVTYLLLEIAFSARLLDVIWGARTQEEIHGIEHYGRLLSGLALWLAIFGLWIVPVFQKSIGRLLLISVVSLALTLPSMYYGQVALVNYLSSSSSPEKLQRSLYVSILTNNFKDGTVQLTGLEDLTHRESPEFKAFVSLMPAILIHDKNIASKADELVRRYIDNQIIREIGTLDTMNNRFNEGLREIQTGYNDYVKGVNDYYSAIDTEPTKRANIEWANYQKSLRERLGNNYRKRLDNASINRRAANEVRKNLPEIPGNWDAKDEWTFKKTVREKVRREINAKFNSNLRQSTSGYPGLYELLKNKDATWDQYSNHDSIVNSFRRLSGLPEKYAKQAHPRMSKANLNRKIYTPLYNEIFAEQISRFESDIQDFTPNGKHYDVAVDSVKLAVIPPIALLFSLAGVLFHIVKLAGYLTKLLHVTKLEVQAVSMSVLIGVFYYPTTLTTEITSNKLYDFLEGTVETHGSVVYASTIKWIIHLEGQTHPIGEWVRTNLLNDFKFERNGEH